MANVSFLNTESESLRLIPKIVGLLTVLTIFAVLLFFLLGMVAFILSVILGQRTRDENT